MTIGEKRNKLMAMATGKYVAYIDDDDMVSPDYISLVLEALKNGDPDVIGIIGIYSTNDGRGVRKTLFYHTIKNSRYWTSSRGFERPPNHLNPMRKSIAEQYSFMPSNFGEDTDWAMRICEDKVLKVEKFIQKPIYYYDYVKDKTY